MEHPPISIENKSEKEIADFLVREYPNEIKSVETFDPDKIEVEQFTLSELKNLFKEKIEDEDERGLALHCVKFLHNPIIEDTFDNDRDARINFIDKITDNGKNEGLDRFFVENRLKLANIRGFLRMIYFLDRYKTPDKHLPDNIMEDYQKLSLEVNPDRPTEGYGLKDLNEKLNLIETIAKLSRNIISHYISKYVANEELEKAA